MKETTKIALKRKNKLFFYLTAVLAALSIAGANYLIPDGTLLLKALAAAGMFMAASQAAFIVIYFTLLR